MPRISVVVAGFRLFTAASLTVALFTTASSAMADDPAPDSRLKASLVEMLLQHFDRNGDGDLNEQEKASAREVLARHLAPGNDTDRPSPSKRTNRPKVESDRVPAAALKRFDKDGDGKLNETERAAAKDALAKVGGIPGGTINREALVKRFDKDGDGTLSDEEQAAAKAEFSKLRGELNLTPGEGTSRKSRLGNGSLLRKFDKDGDGQLNDDEKAAAREAFRNRPKEK